jgi:integrase
LRENARSKIFTKNWENVMATIIRKVSPVTGKVSLLGQLRIKGLSSGAKTIKCPTPESEVHARAALEQWAKDLEKELREQAGTVRPDYAQLTLAALIREYLNDDETKQLKSVDGVRGRLAWWIKQYGGMHPRDLINAPTLRAARTLLQKTSAGRSHEKQGRARGTVNRHLAALRSVCSFGQQAGILPTSIVWPKKLLLKEPRGRVRFLDDAERVRLLAAAKSIDPVIYAVILTAIATGLRRGELLRLAWTDLDFARETLTVNESKNGDRRRVYLPPSVCAALQALKKLPVVHTVSVFVQPSGVPLGRNSLETGWRKIRTAAHLENFHFHDCRHTAASYLAQAGASLVQIGAQLGHRSLNMALRYSHLVEGAATPAHAAIEAKLSASTPAQAGP